MDTSKSIVYFGPSGTFSEMALDQFIAAETEIIHRYWGSTARDTVKKISAHSPSRALDMVRSGEAKLACIPIESSVEGSVPATSDALVTGSRVQIFAETVLPVTFTIAAKKPRTEISTIAVFGVALAQVRESIDRLFPGVDILPATSNSGAAQDVANGLADAAVTTELAAQLNNIPVLEQGVADISGATTRFVLVGLPAEPTPATGRDRTSVVLDLPSEPGSLMRAMSEFALRNVDLIRIESRPQRERPGEYYFHLDCVGHLSDPRIAHALKSLRDGVRGIRFLGSWATTLDDGNSLRPFDDGHEWVAALLKGEAVSENSQLAENNG